MSDAKEPRSGVLDPVERSMEALFGLIMVLTFTGSLSVLSAGRQDVKEMLIAAIGCNLAWGILDACFYLMGVMATRGRGFQLVRRLRGATNDTEVAEVMNEALPPIVVETLTPADRTTMRQRIIDKAGSHQDHWLEWNDLIGALGVFLWVFLITFPVALPFLFFSDAFIALRISNGIAILLLGVIGWRLATYAGFRKWITILSMVVFGVIMVAVTIALGG